jgi:hypothetical protein
MGTVMPDGNVIVCTGVAAAGSGRDAITIPGETDAKVGRLGGTTPLAFKNPNRGFIGFGFLMFTVKFQPLSSLEDSVGSCVSEPSLYAPSSG